MKSTIMRWLGRFGTYAALFLFAALLMAMPIAASHGGSHGQGRGDEDDADDTDNAGEERAERSQPAERIDTRRDIERANRPFEMPSGVLNAQCVQTCIESTIRVTSKTPLDDAHKAEIKNRCMEKCGTEKQEQREAKKAFRTNFSEAIRGLNEKQKVARDEFKELKKAIKKTNETGLLTEEEKAKLREAQEAMREKVDELQEKKQELIKSVPEQFKTPRIIARGELINLNRALERARADYAEAKKVHLESRGRIEAQKKDYHLCIKKAGELADDAAQQEQRARCKETKRQFTTDIKTFLLKTADLVIESLNKLKYQVKMSQDISEEEAQKLLDGIEQRIVAVKNARAIVEELKEDVSEGDVNQEQLKEATKIIREAWQETRALFRKDVGLLIQAKLGNIIHRMGRLKEKLVRAKEKLKERGGDVAALDELLSALDEKLANAKADYEAAVKLFAEAHSAKNVDAAIRQAHDLVKKARAELKEAQQLLRKVTAGIKVQMRAPTEAESEETTSEAEAPESEAAEATP